MRELERDLPTSATATPRAFDLSAIAIVGAGRIGGSLATAARRAGISTTILGRGEALDRGADAEAALLCVPDAEIEAATAVAAQSVPPLRLVGHTSGATKLEALAAAIDAGAATFSLHPLQTAPDAETDLTGAPCAISGSDPTALAYATALAERLGLRPFEIAEADRAAYHAAAVIASNFLVALEESAARLLGELGVADARELLTPLVLRTASNWAERGPDALTGPIARGDEATVSRHLEALEQRAPELVELYRALAERTRELAR
jgi:predicted short-subunit dehydrogenase-like oxidoreductase (DUF2520 family)